MDCRGLSKEYMMSVATEGKLFIWMDGACKLMQFYMQDGLSRVMLVVVLQILLS